MSINRIAIVSLPVTDPERSRAFFCDVLGFEVRRDNPMGPNQRWVEVAPPGANTSLTLVTWFETMPPGSVTGLVLDTADIEDSHRQLTERGLDIGAIESAPWGRFATFKDPDGNGFVLQEASQDL